MSEIARIALPFFGLVFLGYGVGRWGPIKRDGLPGLEFFVRYLALPAFYFQLLARTPFDQLTDWSFVLTTTFATYCAFAIAFSFAALINRGRVPEATVAGLAGSYSASSYLAPGLTLAAFGSAAAAPTALVVAFDSVMLLVLTPLMMALGATERASFTSTLRRIGRDISARPLIPATVGGFAVSAIGFGLPGPVDALASLLGQAAAPAALFVVGLMLSERPVGRVPADVSVLIAIKLVAHPVIAYLLLTWIGGFDPIWVASAVLIAALPPAADALAIARHYRSYVARASTAVLFGALASVATITIALALVVLRLLPLEPFR